MMRDGASGEIPGVPLFFQRPAGRRMPEHPHQGETGPLSPVKTIAPPRAERVRSATAHAEPAPGGGRYAVPGAA